MSPKKRVAWAVVVLYIPALFGLGWLGMSSDFWYIVTLGFVWLITMICFWAVRAIG